MGTFGTALIFGTDKTGDDNSVWVGSFVNLIIDMAMVLGTVFTTGGSEFGPKKTNGDIVYNIGYEKT